jgi:2-iminobutanoate/2-iminopropanoate deaminase
MAHSEKLSASAPSANVAQFVDAPAAPAPIGHYHHAVVLPTGFVQLSGQKAWRPEDGVLIDGDVAAQTRLALSNIGAVLAGLGLDFSHLTRLVCHLHDPNDYPAFNATYAEELGAAMPTRAVLAGAALRGGALVEIIADAFDPRLASNA